MSTTVRASLSLAVLGAGLVAASVHGPVSGAVEQAGRPAVVAAATVYLPPPVPAARTTAHPHVAVAPRTHATARHVAPAHRFATRGPRRAPHRVVRRPVASGAFRDALMAAVARIPTYRSGASRWVVSRAYDFWGTADWYHDVLYVSPDVPRNRLYDVAVHEWSHELSVLDYSGDVAAATNAMNTWFGGTGLTGPERAADCMAILQGATWTHYTTCTNTKWRAGARLLVSGERL